MAKEKYCVYMHVFPNGKVYIGITSQSPSQRWRDGNGYKAQLVHRAIEKYGWENIQHIILFNGLSKQEAERKEIELIRIFSANNPNYGYNVENGGNCIGTHSEQTKKKIAESNHRRKISEETRKKQSIAHSGVKMSDEQKRKISESLKGRRFSEETKAKMSAASKGRVVSDKTRQKIRKAKSGKSVIFSNPELRGKKISDAMRERYIEKPEIREKMLAASIKKCSKSIVQKDLQGNVIANWKSAAEIERALGINHAQISRACKTYVQCHGYLWEFL